MPQPLSNQSAQTRTVIDYTPQTGASYAGPTQQTTQATSNLPVIVPPVLIGCDAVPFSVAGGTTVLTFSNLIKRDNIANPINPTVVSGNTITVRPSDVMMFIVTVQGATNVIATPLATDKDNLQVQGPFLGATKYTTFQVEIQSTGPAKGWIIGQLIYQVQG